MHLTSSAQVDVLPGAPILDFAWLELTNRCNLQCVHCYAESAPTSGDKDLLMESDYLSLIRQIRNLGCEKIQFIGGEPTLNRSLPVLLQAARDAQFMFIEVFTNLTRLPQRLLDDLCRLGIAVASSFYSSDPKIHDSITRQSGSFRRTVESIRRVLKAGLVLRIGIIEMDENRADIAKTWDFLQDLGVQNIGTDRLRKIGRASPDSPCDMRELCGSCAGRIVSIGPDGVVAPCNMSKRWAVGSVLDKSLEEIVTSPALINIRKEIMESTTDTHSEAMICTPKACGPANSCCPNTQQCYPCAPNGCSPCRPKG